MRPAPPPLTQTRSFFSGTGPEPRTEGTRHEQNIPGSLAGNRGRDAFLEISVYSSRDYGTLPSQVLPFTIFTPKMFAPASFTHFAQLRSRPPLAQTHQSTKDTNSCQIRVHSLVPSPSTLHHETRMVPHDRHSVPRTEVFSQPSPQSTFAPFCPTQIPPSIRINSHQFVCIRGFFPFPTASAMSLDPSCGPTP